MTALVASVLLLVNVVMLMSTATGAGPQASVEDPGVSGYVLTPDGAPVSGGRVIARLGMVSSTTSIDPTGRFRVVPARSGVHQFVVSVPGLAPFRFMVTVPPSRSLRLPVIRLSAGASFRVRLVSAGGEPILAPQFHRRQFDARGGPIADALGDQPSDPSENDGAVTIGPLPRGIITLAVDMPFFAQTRLPDVNAADSTRNIDGGTIVIQQPGAVLNVDVVDGAGTAVPNHVVLIEDPRPRSPLVFPPERTNPQGRATFDRLAAGQYRISTTAVDRCAGVWLTASRVVPVFTNGTAETPLVIGGRARFRITSPLGPEMGAQISASPDVPTPPSPFPFRTIPSGCRGVTDGEGRVTLTNFPPGPAHVDVRMTNSTYIRQVLLSRSLMRREDRFDGSAQRWDITPFRQSSRGRQDHHCGAGLIARKPFSSVRRAISGEHRRAGAQRPSRGRRRLRRDHEKRSEPQLRDTKWTARNKDAQTSIGGPLVASGRCRSKEAVFIGPPARSDASNTGTTRTSPT